MWDTYDEYCLFMRSKECEPVGEEIFNRDYRRKSEEEKEAERLAHTLFVSRKSASHGNIEPTLSNHESKPTTQPLKVNLMDRIAASGKTSKEPTLKKPKAAPRIKEPKPRYRPPKIYTDEEIKARRAERRKAKREELKAKGLTVQGTPRKTKEKKVITPQEKQERQKRYSRTWREKNRERHLAYRREYRERQKEASRKHRAEHLEEVREKQRIWARDYRARKRLQSSQESGCAA